MLAKEEVASPTVSTNTLMIILAVDAIEEQDVVSTDVVRAYINADMPDILCKVNPIYIPFVSFDQGHF